MVNDTTHSRRTIKVFLENGDDFVTDINGDKETIRSYYEGHLLNMASAYNEECDDIMVRCTHIEFLD
jgi:hypothetical protein